MASVVIFVDSVLIMGDGLYEGNSEKKKKHPHTSKTLN